MDTENGGGDRADTTSPTKEGISEGDFEAWLAMHTFVLHDNPAALEKYPEQFRKSMGRTYKAEEPEFFWRAVLWGSEKGFDRGMEFVTGPETRFGLADKIKPELMGKRIRDWGGV